MTVSQKKKVVGVSLRPDLAERLDEMAAEAGIHPARLAALFLEELLPTVASVRTRLQITRVPTNGAPK